MCKRVPLLAGALVILVSSAATAFEVELDKLTCRNQQETVGDDEIFLKVTADGDNVDGFGRDVVHNMRRGRAVTLARKVNARSNLVVEICERDGDKHDSLGTVTIRMAGADSETVKGTIRLGNYEYELTWK